MWKTILAFLAVASVSSGAKFKVIREWNYLNFTWPSDDDYQRASSQGQYVPENNIIAGIKYFENYFYITLPRMKSGVPATLTRIPAGIVSDTAPLLMPFPSWEMNIVGDCDALQNVQNVEIDPKGRIWIVDGGRVETLGPRSTAKCPPKLVVYDIKRNMTVLTHVFPEKVASSDSSFLYDIVVDDSDDGYAYITDNSGRDPGIVVFSFRDRHSWKIRHSQSMRADPSAVSFKVNDVFITAPLNIAPIALGPRVKNADDRITVSDDREVYYSPISSLHLYSINTSVLRNADFAMGNGEFQGNVKDYGLKRSQTVGMIMDNQGILYYNLLASNRISKWDTRTPFQSGQIVIAEDKRYLEWPHSFAFDDNGNLTVLSNRLNKFIYDRLSMNEPNFRLITSMVGGKSYIYDDNYEYQSNSGGSRQDEVNLYQPKFTNAMTGYSQSTTESQIDQDTRDHMSHMDHGLMNHMDDHMHHQYDQRNETKEKINSGSDVVAATCLSVLFAVMAFVV